MNWLCVIVGVMLGALITKTTAQEPAWAFLIVPISIAVVVLMNWEWYDRKRR
jgi:type III secretory pathway component EscS